MDYLEKLSIEAFDKQMLFLQDDGTYYNKYECKYMTELQAEEFLTLYINN
jgi:hypothetical protein